VVFITYGGKVVMENSARLAIREAQDAFVGLAEEIGLKTEEDVIALGKQKKAPQYWKHINTPTTAQAI